MNWHKPEAGCWLTLTNDRDRVSVFVFGTRLTRITRMLRNRSIDSAMERVSEQVHDWSGGTRIGQSLQAFNTTWARRVLRNGAVVLIISDGWAAIEVAWTETIGFLADTWSLFTGTLAKTWHSTVGFIKKACVRLKGLFDSDLDIEAEVRRIDDDTSAKNEAANEQMLGAIGKREQERKIRREEIERERQGRAEALGTMQDADDTARRRAGQDAIATAAADLETAKQ
jgi:hypothetical protein